jgi:hypothetical protein
MNLLFKKIIPDPVVIIGFAIVEDVPEHDIDPPLLIVIVPVPAKVPAEKTKLPVIDTDPLKLQVVPPHVKVVEEPIETVLNVALCEADTITFPELVVDNDELNVHDDEIVKLTLPPIVTTPLKVVVAPMFNDPNFN